MHEGTRFALSDYSLNGQGLEILSAYSAAEGRTLMRDNPDIAAVLLDVIMETDVAGLELVEYIRNEIKNETVRIILRTGQPGQAPERRVIVQYDINDYKAKTELTADKLFTSLTAALRSYQQLERMVQTRRGLEIIIDAASTLYDFKSMQRLAEGVLTQIASLLNVDCAGILVLRDDGSGKDRGFLGAGRLRLLQPLHRHRRPRNRSIPTCATWWRRRSSAARTSSPTSAPCSMSAPGRGREVVVLLQAERPLSETDRSLVEIFCSRLSIAFDNVILYQQLQRGQHPARGPRRPAHPRADAGQPPPVGAMAAPAARQRLQERDSRHRRARPEEPARRHPRPHRDADRADRDRGRPRKASPPRSSTSATPPSG